MDAHNATLVGTVIAASSGRVGAFAAGLVGLASLVIGGLAVARAGERRRSRATVAMGLGLIAIAGGGLVVATSDGGVGTGNGLGGAVVAVVLGSVGTILSGLARTRARS
jgi:hypothetical protein